jgi:hypothetical protein
MIIKITNIVKIIKVTIVGMKMKGVEMIMEFTESATSISKTGKITMNLRYYYKRYWYCHYY